MNSKSGAKKIERTGLLFTQYFAFTAKYVRK